MEYKEFGSEWEKEMMKFSKREIIDFLRLAWIKARSENKKPCEHCGDPDCHWILHG